MPGLLIGKKMKVLSFFVFAVLLISCADSDNVIDLIVIDQMHGSNFYINYDNGETGVFSSGTAEVKRRLEKASKSCNYAVFFARVRAYNSTNDIYDISIHEVVYERGLKPHEIDNAENVINNLPYKSGKICFPLNG